MTKAKSSVVSDFIAPVGVLLAICIVMSALLAVTNGVTAPIIKDAAEKAEKAAMAEVLPEAGGSFDAVQGSGESKSAHVTAAYKATNGSGYVFMVTGNGYGGKNTLKLIVGIGADGRLVDTKVLEHAETVGLGAKIEGDGFRSQFPGKDAGSYRGIDLISGATFSSNYYLNALEAAFSAYDTVKGG